LQPYPVVADALLEIVMAVISATLSLDEHITDKHFLNFVASRCIVALFGTSFLGYALLNVLWPGAYNFDAK
jgi:hypothetical protein